MKKLKSLLYTIVLSFFITSCACNLTCINCETLDEENCNCIPMECGHCETPDLENCTCIVDIECQCNDGIKNGDEEYIDCGGVCDPCTCDFTPCIHLTNEASKIWKPVAIGDKDGNIIDTNPTIELECRVDHTAIFVGEDVTWRFDNPQNPYNLIFTRPSDEISSDIVFLSSDSLALYFPIAYEHVYYIPK